MLYSFAGGSDGAYPGAAPIAVGAQFYGTTSTGGNGGCAAVKGCGTAYAMTTSGQETVLHIFSGGSDGEAPGNSLVNLGGKLYGTTVYGGGSGCASSSHTLGCGTVYYVTTAGSESVIYRFPGEAKGAQPSSALTLYNGDLYGEAAAGGTGGCSYRNYAGCGLIFKVTPSGTASVVYTFKGGSDGAAPSGGLVMLGGDFYGTTASGGINTGVCSYGEGCGTVFELTPSGTKTTLHVFGGAPNDGSLPRGGLAILNGVLYGITFSGGANGCGLTYYNPCGTVFKITVSGQEQVLYNFTGTGGDGAFPAGLTAISGNLYGTAEGHGLNQCGNFFEMTPSGKETIVYQFAISGSGDACGPTSSAIDVNNTFYGTSQSGGAHGYGAFYSVTP